MIETVVFGAAYDGTVRFEGDLEDGLAYITLRLVNGSPYAFHGEVVDDTNRVVTVDAPAGQTVEVAPDPPVFLIVDLLTPNGVSFGVAS